MILILDSSNKALTTILVGDDGNFFEGTPWQENHQKHLLPEVEKLLQEAGCKVEDLNVLACVAGPGSFTGVRLAVGTVKGFCLVNKKAKVVSINMLHLLAQKPKQKGIKNFALATKCTSTRVYCLLSLSSQTKQMVCTNGEFVRLCQQNKLKMFGFGIDELEGESLEQICIDANDYVKYVFGQIKQKKFVQPNALEPIYMALSQAEEELLKKEQHDSNPRG